MILLIETSSSICSVALADNKKIAGVKESEIKNSHAARLNLLIIELLKESSANFDEIQAVCVSKGPGSYTGLRIGVSASKGICFGKDIPLLSCETLLSMTYNELIEKMCVDLKDVLLCPMIDARRMEVYYALYNIKKEEIKRVVAEVIDEKTFFGLLESNKILFFGDGAAKCNTVIKHPNAIFIDNIFPSAKDMLEIADKKFRNKEFEDLAYFEPFYLKQFIAGKPRVKGLE